MPGASGMRSRCVPSGRTKPGAPPRGDASWRPCASAVDSTTKGDSEMKAMQCRSSAASCLPSARSPAAGYSARRLRRSLITGSPAARFFPLSLIAPSPGGRRKRRVSLSPWPTRNAAAGSRSTTARWCCTWAARGAWARCASCRSQLSGPGGTLQAVATHAVPRIIDGAALQDIDTAAALLLLDSAGGCRRRPGHGGAAPLRPAPRPRLRGGARPLRRDRRPRRRDTS